MWLTALKVLSLVYRNEATVRQQRWPVAAKGRSFPYLAAGIQQFATIWITQRVILTAAKSNTRSVRGRPPILEAWRPQVWQAIAQTRRLKVFQGQPCNLVAMLQAMHPQQLSRAETSWPGCQQAKFGTVCLDRLGWPRSASGTASCGSMVSHAQLACGS